MSKGSYTGTNYPDPLYNKSQEVCERPRDTIPPCAPPLTITNECDLIENSEWDKTHWKNYLHWQVSSSDCGGDIVRYKIYFKAPLTKDFVLLDSSLGKNDTSYTHDLSLSTTGIAGCYRLTAVDNAGNETDSVFTVCTDNCPLYELPNVFTPNGDGANELFIPFPYRFIGSIDMTITDRWGNVVFTTQNPDILWDGKDMKTGKPVAEGVYFYSGKYYEETLIGKVERPLPPGKNGGGFIHLMRNK
jgi:gliding motility-associated-like protein